jgi:hypothetical protein
MFVNLLTGARLGQYFTTPLSALHDEIVWAKGYVGFTCKIGKVLSDAGQELGPDEKVNLNTRIVLEPTKPLVLKKGVADIVPTTFILGLGTPIYQWRLIPNPGEDAVRITLRASKPLKVADLLNQPLCTCFVID